MSTQYVSWIFGSLWFLACLLPFVEVAIIVKRRSPVRQKKIIFMIVGALIVTMVTVVLATLLAALIHGTRTEQYAGWGCTLGILSAHTGILFILIFAEHIGRWYESRN